MFSRYFEIGMAEALEKRAQLAGENGILTALNAAANIKGLSDITNRTLEKRVSDDRPSTDTPSSKGRRKSRKLKMSIDPALFRALTPEQRKSLFFAVRRIKPNV